MATFWAIILFVFLLGIMILVHEFGHFAAARLVKITVEEFSIGMGPVIWSKVKKNVKYSLRAFPIGGFVKMLGENDMDLKVKGSFGSKTAWQRLFVVIAGVLMNFVLVILIGYLMGGLSSFEYYFPSDLGTPALGPAEEKTLITQIAEGSPAEEVGLEPGDIVLSVDGEAPEDVSHFIDYVNAHKGAEISLEIKEAYSGDSKITDVTPREDPPEGEGAIGISIGGVYRVHFEGWTAVFSGPAYAIDLAAYVSKGFVSTIATAFKEKTAAPVADMASGPVGLFFFIRTALEQAVPMAGIVELFGIVGISLVFVNLLPIPALDGGYVLFLLIEGISGKRLPGKVLNWITQIGMVLLILLIIFIMAKDLLTFTNLGVGLCRAFGWFCG